MLSVLPLLSSLLLAAPGPPPAFFADHRAQFRALLPADAVAVFRSGFVGDEEVDDVYRQDSDFWYLTGFPEPEAVAVLRPGAPEGKRYTLFVQAKDWAAEQWTGRRAGVEGARDLYGADEAYPVTEFWDRLPELLKGARALYLRDGRDPQFRDRLEKAWRARDANATSERPLIDAGPIVARMRLVKSDAEMALLRGAVELSVQGHRAAMQAVAPDRYEHALKAVMVEACLAGGAARMAYPAIVGSGPNSVLLHYADANRKMQAGEIIVNDTACEYSMYAADVTRSYPVSGKFSPEQRAIYEIVLAAEKAGIEAVRPGVPFHQVYEATVSVVVDGLLRLGLLSGDKDEAIRTRAFKKFYPHGSSHWLGLNVHDVGSYEQDEGVERRDRYFYQRAKLEPGMVITVEPGIYIPEGSTPNRGYWNIGARIEDDVLVTATGSECLSCGLAREVAEVEKALTGGK